MKDEQTQKWDGPGEECDTLFFQGIGTSQTQVLKYVGNQKIKATTGQLMWSEGCKSLKPLDVIKKPHLGVEVGDIRFNVFTSYWSYLNPINIISSAITWGANCYYGVHFTRPIPQQESIAYHVPTLSKISVGQKEDMQSHREKYLTWLSEENKSKNLILWGVSRGTAATFCAYAKEKYPEVKLVVLEGAIDSTQNILSHYLSPFGTRLASGLKSAVNSGLSFFKRKGYIGYDPQGPSPLNSINEFPEGTPVVFITSKIDNIVPCKNTERIAQALADKGKNPVYLLKLERSSHPNYMFDDVSDRAHYAAFIHAIYKKYNLKHDIKPAEKGALLVDTCLVPPLGDKVSTEEAKSTIGCSL
ncbi:hypothetical protein [Legionella sp. km772]|uniref:hypothetical protein n=1 Tax=Legionella sp. km772 TaxID=2498111 RepID=UPI000F8E83DC|nr:hypothetical protein [Legionella sp. km772]RUR12365.1 hypothetical protein ELY15_05260 [Legionella sp. km772]